MATVPTRSSRSAAAPAKRLSLAEITKKGSGLPNRYILHGVEKVGKTSFAAWAPGPIFAQTKGETGLETLIDSGRLPEVAHFPELQSWTELLDAVDALITGEHDYKTFVLDTLNGGERLCHEHVCARDFGGDWGERGFAGYQRGFEVSLAEWRRLLSALDALREKRRMSIVCLCHTKIAPYRNPIGADFDRFQPDMHAKTWGLSHKWADAILFLNFETFVDEANPKKKGKATMSQARFMYTEKHAAYDAGNRLGLAGEIDMGNTAQESWNNFKAALVAGRNGKES